MATYVYVVLIVCFSLCRSMTPVVPTQDTATPMPPVTTTYTTLGGPLAPSTGHSLQVCYSCRYIGSIRQCRHAKYCQQGQSCLYGKVNSGDYYLDCIPKVACDGLEPLFSSQGTVTFSGATFTQFKCCTTDRCNKSPEIVPPAVGK